MPLIKKILKSAIILNADALNEGIKFKLKLNELLPQNHVSKYRKEYLVRGCKELMLAIIELYEQRYAAPSPRTIVNIFKRLRMLVRWMWGREMWRFGQLTQSDIHTFIESVSSWRGGRVSKKTLEGHQNLLKLMWELRGRYTSSLRASPYWDNGVDDLLQAAPKVQKWLPVKEDVAVALISAALRWIDESISLLLAVLGEIKAYESTLIGKTDRQRKRYLNAVYRKIAEDPSFVRLAKLADVNDHPNIAIRDCLRRFQGAVMIVILFFTGMRGSELLSLKRGCVQDVLHSNGKVYQYLAGIAAKKSGMSRTWIAPSPVIDAIYKFQELTRVRLHSPTEYLFYRYSGNGCIPKLGRSVRRLAGTTSASSDVLHFILNSSHKIRGELNDKFHLHQARKTFARFVAIRDKRALDALASHYGHVSSAITDSRYVGSDIPLHELIDEESRADLSRGLSDLISSPSLAGPGSSRLHFAVEASDIRFKGIRAIRGVVDDLIKKGVALSPCEWGYCIYSKDTSACGGTEFGPSHERRTPSVCSSCKNFVVTEKYRSWWEARYRRETDFLSQVGISDQAKIVCQSRLQETEEILRALNSKPFVRS